MDVSAIAFLPLGQSTPFLVSTSPRDRETDGDKKRSAHEKHGTGHAVETQDTLASR